MATNARPRSVLCATGAGDDVLDGFDDVVGVQLLDVGVGQVGGQREGVAALLGDLLGQQVDPVLAAGDEHDGGALGGEPAGGGLTDAAAGAGDQCDGGHESGGRGCDLRKRDARVLPGGRSGGDAALWRGGLHLDRGATVEDIAIETAAVARTLATAGRTT